MTLAKDKPFEFLDHAIRCGDSLVGIKDLDQIKYFNLDPQKAERGLFTGPSCDLVDEAVTLRKKIEAMPVNTVEDVQAEERLLAAAEEKTARLRYAADLLLSVEFQPGTAAAKENCITAWQFRPGITSRRDLEEFRAVAKKARPPTFHWPLEFPEVIRTWWLSMRRWCIRRFMGGTQKIRALSVDLLCGISSGIIWLIGQEVVQISVRILFTRAYGIREQEGDLGLTGHEHLAQGDTREAGLISDGGNEG